MNFLDFFKKKKVIERPNYKNVVSKTSSRELVVSVYKEKIEWLIKRQSILGDREIISAYVKSDRNDFGYVEKLPNIGRESHTYIHHIIKNYDNLADFTTFIQGGPFFHFHEGDNPNLEFFNFAEEPTHDYNPLGDFAMTDCFGRPFSHWDVDLFPVWDRLFEGNMPHRFFANYGAQFIVSRDVIQNRSIEFWQELYKMHKEIEYLPWALEIMWYYVFDPRYKAKI
jgi:hypothetical protein